jgi:23S rRNA (uracil1939-C5)-methyltransferase
MAPERWTVRLERLAYGGEAVGRLPDGRVMFVPFGLPGEVVEARVVEEKRHYLRGELLTLLEAAPQRIPPRCQHFFTPGRALGSVCGGCHYQHLPYPAQLEAKRAILHEQLTRYGHIANPPLQAPVASPQAWEYRNHIQFHLTQQGKAGFVCAHPGQGEGDVIAISECHLPAAPLNTFWPLLDFETGLNFKRIALRLGSEDEVMLVLVSDSPQPPDLAVEAGISVVHVWQENVLVLAGDRFLWMDVTVEAAPPVRRTFRLSPTSFFQVNTPVAGKMVAYLLQRLPLSSKTTLLDVYCGVGLFSAFLAPHVGRVIGIELSPPACEDFAFNLNEFDHVELYEAPAGEVLPALQEPVDVAIVDPPRAGLEKTALEGLLRLAPPWLAYVSCDAATLARDAARLTQNGYRLLETTPFDLFPQTYHIESISLFTR